jgi:hypothetical protein
VRFFEWLWPRLADRRRWRAEEQTWSESERYPQRIVRVYRSQRQLRRDARRLRKLGYEIRFQETSRIRSGNWLCHVTYDHHDARR